MESYRVELDRLKIGIEADLGIETDFDISVFLLGSNNKILSQNHLLYFGSDVFSIDNNLYQSIPEKSIYVHPLDYIKSGNGIENEFDELFYIDFNKINKSITEIKFIIHLYHLPGLGTSGNELFTKNCTFNLKVLDFDSDKILSNFNFESDFSNKGSVELISMKNQKSKWYINKSEISYYGKLPELIESFS